MIGIARYTEAYNQELEEKPLAVGAIIDGHNVQDVTYQSLRLSNSAPGHKLLELRRSSIKASRTL